MKKFTRSEGFDVLSPEQHDAVQDQLHALGKTSATELTDAERETFDASVDSSDTTQ